MEKSRRAWCFLALCFVCVAMLALGVSGCSSGSGLTTKRDAGADAAAVKADSAIGGTGGGGTATGGAGGSTAQTAGAGGNATGGTAGTTTAAGGTGGTTIAAGGTGGTTIAAGGTGGTTTAAGGTGGTTIAAGGAGGTAVADAASDAPADAPANPDQIRDTGTVDALAVDAAPDTAACGGPGQPCCAGSVCENSGCCGTVDGESNRCVVFGSYCFPGSGGAICAGSPCPPNPGPCGGSGQPCCANGGIPFCTAPDTACVSYMNICMALPSSSTDAARVDAPLAPDGSPADGRPAADVGSADGCTLPTTLTFGHFGGTVLFQYANQLDTSGIVIVTRVPVRGGYSDGGVLSCSWALPACGTPGAVTLATIAADLADADVQAAFAADATPLYGIDERPSDGSIFSITRADGHTILVGVPCSWRPSDPCLAIPAGVQHLADDLASLSSAALADPACQGLSVY